MSGFWSALLKIIIIICSVCAWLILSVELEAFVIQLCNKWLVWLNWCQISFNGAMWNCDVFFSIVLISTTLVIVGFIVANNFCRFYTFLDEFILLCKGLASFISMLRTIIGFKSAMVGSAMAIRICRVHIFSDDSPVVSATIGSIFLFLETGYSIQSVGISMFASISC